jgi:hypothetical protein
MKQPAAMTPGPMFVEHRKRLVEHRKRLKGLVAAEGT